MVEIPEHLLQRSREAMAEAQGKSVDDLYGDGGGDAAAAPEEPAAEETAPTPEPAPEPEPVAVEQAAPVTQESSEEPTGLEPAAAAAPAAVEASEPPKVYAPPSRPSGTGRQRHGAKVPVWMYSVYIGFPILAVLYAVAFVQLGETEDEGGGILAEGEAVYSANCASCHGGSGEGGVGPTMSTVVEVFGSEADHIAWVADGSAASAGRPYGDDGAGNNGSPATGGMPAFGSTLSEEEIAAVVTFERVEYAGEQAPAEGAEGEEPADGGDEAEEPASVDGGE